MRPGRLVRQLGSGCVAVGLLAAVFHGVDRSALAAALGGADPVLIGLSVPLYAAAAVGARAARFHAILSRVERVSGATTFRASAVGFLAMDTLPFRSGELVRPLMLVRSGVPFATSLGVVVAERLLDLAVVVPLVLAVAAGSSLPPAVLEVGGRAVDGVAVLRGAIAGGLVLALLVAAALLACPDRAARFARVTAARLGGTASGRFASAARALGAGLGPLRHPPTLLLGLALSLLVWGALAVSLHLIAAAVGAPNLDLWTGPVLISSCFLFMLLPPPPLQAGVLDAAVVGALTLRGADLPVAAAALLLVRATHYGVLGPFAAWALMKETGAWADVRRAVARSQGPAAE